MPFTAEQREKALETRKRNALDRRLKKQTETTGNATTEMRVPDADLERVDVPSWCAATTSEHIPCTLPRGHEGPHGARNGHVVQEKSTTKIESEEGIERIYSDDWATMSLDVAVNELAKLKRAYDRAAQIIFQRQSRVPRTWTCWTQTHIDIVSKSVVSQCRDRVPDGKWAFKDDGYRNAEGKIDPQVVCSQLCFAAYQLEKSKKISSLSRH